MPKLHIRKGDLVLAIAGKDKGKTGKVLRVFPQKKRVIVEGLNFAKKHTRPRPPQQQGGILQQEVSVHLSNMMLYCSKCSKGSRLGRRKLGDGTKIRFCRRCSEQIGKG